MIVEKVLENREPSSKWEGRGQMLSNPRYIRFKQGGQPIVKKACLENHFSILADFLYLKENFLHSTTSDRKYVSDFYSESP
jgi:hypothetical protein